MPLFGKELPPHRIRILIEEKGPVEIVMIAQVNVVPGEASIVKVRPDTVESLVRFGNVLQNACTHTEGCRLFETELGYVPYNELYTVKHIREIAGGIPKFIADLAFEEFVLVRNELRILLGIVPS